MSFRLKAAIAAALLMSAVSAVTSSDMTSAAEASLSTAPLPGITELQAPAAGRKPAVVFAAPREIAQPLGTTDTTDTLQSTEGSAPATSLAALVDAQGAPEALDGDMKCLAGAVYFESKGESLEGQLAVARVIINRAKSGRFADSLCGVVYQPSQFSFVRGHGMPPIRMASEAWREAVAIAQIAMTGGWSSKAEGALFFHARRVSPGWGKARLALIDNHIFYR